MTQFRGTAIALSHKSRKTVLNGLKSQNGHLGNQGKSSILISN